MIQIRAVFFLSFCSKTHALRILGVSDEVHLEYFYSQCRNFFRACCHLPDAGSSVGVWSGSLMIPSVIWSRHRNWYRIVSVVPKEEKRSICVSCTVADLSDTITEEPVSCDSAEENLQGLRGVLGPNQQKAAKPFERAEAQAATSQSSSLLSLAILPQFPWLISPSPFLHCQNISARFVSTLASSLLFPSFRSSRMSINIKMSWETSLSLTQTMFGVSQTRRSLGKNSKKHRFVIPVVLLREFLLDCLFLIQFTFSHSVKFVIGVKCSVKPDFGFCDINCSKWWNTHQHTNCLSMKSYLSLTESLRTSVSIQ